MPNVKEIIEMLLPIIEPLIIARFGWFGKIIFAVLKSILLSNTVLSGVGAGMQARAAALGAGRATSAMGDESDAIAALASEIAMELARPVE